MRFHRWRHRAWRHALHVLGVVGLLAAACPAAVALDPDRAIDQFHHSNWTFKEGAPGQVAALAQTNDGYLWLGTQTGLFRFDGVSFERYEPPIGQALPSTSVSALLAPASGGLWIGFRYGAAAFLNGGRLSVYLPEQGFSTGSVFGFEQDRSGTVWAATFQGLVRLQGERWEKIGMQWGYPGKQARAVFSDRDGTLWVATEDALVYLPAGEKRFRRLERRYGVISQIIQGPDGRLWVSESNGVVRTVLLSGSGPRDEGPVLNMTSAGILFDRDHGLWVASPGDGIRRLPHVDQTPAKPIEAMDALAQAFTEKDGLSADYAWPSLEDREGNIWIGTSRGLDRFRHSNLLPAPFPNGAYDFALAAGAGGAVWAGSKNRSLMRLKGSQLSLKPQVPIITCAYRDRDGLVWFGGAGGIWRADGEDVRKVAGLPSVTPGAGVQAIAKDKSGALWVSLSSPGVFRLLDGRWTHIVDWPVLNQRASPLVIFIDDKERKWLGFSHNRITLVEGDVSRAYSTADGLDVGNVTAMHQGPEALWVGGENGLDYFDGRAFRRIQTDGGMPLKGISGIVSSDDGDLWLNGGRGVVRIRAADLRSAMRRKEYKVPYELFDFLDGLLGTPAQFRPLPTAAKGTDGRLWFATSGGVTSIDPAHIARNPLAPSVLVRSLTADGATYPPDDSIILAPHTANIRIDYTALSLSIPERVRFKYQLEGLDASWQEAGNRREAFYTNLMPGTYRFRVLASNNDGVWNEQGAVVSFRVLPAFSQTWWFLALCAAVALGMIWLAYLYRLRQIARQTQGRLQERLFERDRIARELHDTLLQGVQGLILRFQAAAQRIPAAEPARQLMEKALERADEVLIEGRDRVHDLRDYAVETDAFPQRVATAGWELSQDSGAEFKLTQQGDERELHPIVCEESFRIVREAMANAFSHANAANVEVQIAYSRWRFRIVVRDDGKGMEPRVLKDGGRAGHWGLLGMKERAEKVGGKLAIWSRPAQGTEVELKIPASAAYRSKNGVSRMFGLFEMKRKEETDE